MRELIIDGITMTLEKKQIKNLYLRILPPCGSVRITAPHSATEATIRMFVSSRMAWIQKHRSRFLESAEQKERQYVSGETYSVWGKKYPLEVIHSPAKKAVTLREDSILLQVREESTSDQRARMMDEWSRELLKNEIPLLLLKCERLVGVKADHCQIKNMRTRWGTCNIQKKRIWLNLQLAKTTPEHLEYVIIHELVHLLEKNHTAVFKGYMDQFCPNWRAIKRELNAHFRTEPV